MSRSRVDLAAPPMSGHLHPVLGIARRLARECDVRVISTEGAAAEVRAAGLEHVPILVGADADIAGIVNPQHRVGNHPWRLHAQFRDNLSLLERLRAELVALWSSAPPDLVIADSVVPSTGAAARALGIPWWSSLPSPVAMETPDGPPGFLGGWKPWPTVAGRVRDAMGRRAVRAFKRGVHFAYRRRLRPIGFPSVYRPDGTEALYSPDCVLALASRELEFARTYPPSVRFVGPVLYSPPASVDPPPFVVGRRHVLVSIGTHLHWHRDALHAAVADAARRLPDLEFHVSEGNRHVRRVESSGNLHTIGYVSYSRDLPAYALVVHHAGAGVLSHTLSAGLPAVVMPVDFDQFDNAVRLEVAGVATRLKKLPDLAAAIARTIRDEPMRARAAAMSPHFAAGAAEERIAAMVAATVSPS